MRSLLVLVLILIAAAVLAGMGLRRRRLAEARRIVRDQRRQAQQEAWNRHMAGKPPGPGHHSSLV